MVKQGGDSIISVTSLAEVAQPERARRLCRLEGRRAR
jgi:hypothetical protein